MPKIRKLEGKCAKKNTFFYSKPFKKSQQLFIFPVFFRKFENRHCKQDQGVEIVKKIRKGLHAAENCVDYPGRAARFMTRLSRPKVGMFRLSRSNFRMLRLYRTSFGVFRLCRPNFRMFQFSRPNKKYSTLFDPVQIFFDFLDQKLACFDRLDQVSVCFEFVDRVSVCFDLVEQTFVCFDFLGPTKKSFRLCSTAHSFLSAFSIKTYMF